MGSNQTYAIKAQSQYNTKNYYFYLKMIFLLFDIAVINMVGSAIVFCIFYITEADALYGEVYNASFLASVQYSNKMDFVNTSAITLYLRKIQIKNMWQRKRPNGYCLLQKVHGHFPS